ncbi:hypothetical protein [Nesterenkonia pannonica]|uniref:hypothetical protein n=1 Tax=Nesterenkonia pannonica TaxID=1548602 RepID=UPI0021641303|nr:hypothetical protein [Nesterenkonia pannonica]
MTTVHSVLLHVPAGFDPEEGADDEGITLLGVHEVDESAYIDVPDWADEYDAALPPEDQAEDVDDEEAAEEEDEQQDEEASDEDESEDEDSEDDEDASEDEDDDNGDDDADADEED